MNEFIIKNGFRSQGNSEVTGSLNVTGGITGSLQGTAAYAESASYATTALQALGIANAVTNNSNNRVLTATGGTDIYAETNLTFDSTVLTLTNGILTFTGSGAGIGRIQQSPGGAANGSYSHAQGLAVSANGAYSHAEGSSTNASGFGSHAEGSGSFTSTSTLYGVKSNTITSGVFQLAGDVTAVFAPGNRLYYNSAAYPDNTTFVVDTSVFGGVNTTITLTNTGITDSNFVVGSLDYLYTSWGGNQPSSADGGHAEGFYTTAVADWSHAEGSQTQTFARYSHAEGDGTQANGTYSHAEGRNAKTFGQYSHAEGRETQAKGDGSHAEGYLTISSGSFSHAEGRTTTANGIYSHAEGVDTTAAGYASHAEGEGTTSNGQASHAEGFYATASGSNSHAEGNTTTATGQFSHAEGYYTTANGYASHVEGTNTTSNGQASHAEGNSTAAGSQYGYLATMPTSGVIVVNASYGDLTGTGTGLFTAGTTLGIDDSAYDNSFTFTSQIILSSSFNGTNTTINLVETGTSTTSASIGSISNFGSNTGDQYWGGWSAHAEGNGTFAIGFSAHAEGSGYAYGNYSHAEGGGYAYGNYSHAEGDGQAFGGTSHAEGGGYAYGNYSHAEGSGIAGVLGFAMAIPITSGVIELDAIYGDQTAQFVAGGFVIVDDYNGEIVPGVKTTYIYEISSSAFNGTPATEITLVDTSVNTASNKARIGIYGVVAPTAANVSIGGYSHAEGLETQALGEFSHAAGNNNRALGYYQSVVGQWNQPISQPSAFIVGDGVDDSTRHNLLVAASGSVTISGSLILTPTASGAPTSPGTDGQIIFGQAGGNYKIYVWLGGAWRSGSLS
jgi:hypothetical protein